LYTFRGQIVVFVAFLNRSCWAEKECHLSLLKQTKIDQAKNQQSFTSFVYKNATKILKTRKANFSGWQLSQVASVLSKEHSKDYKTESGASFVKRRSTLEGTLCLEIMSLSLRLQMKNCGACF
jgi:hypothetical protein